MKSALLRALFTIGLLCRYFDFDSFYPEDKKPQHQVRNPKIPSENLDISPRSARKPDPPVRGSSHAVFKKNLHYDQKERNFGWKKKDIRRTVNRGKKVS
ncbi:unnamed protein product [Soboliphyme baturini]|uniref:Uncharacterized protein n=1 Tax=Soboliphyme baturini TaxID=241478 RepID=A0A183J7M2_9BILA|nr:unnamed protein product [Soboliphyme baturini]